MLILALDTTSEHGGVALWRDFECLSSAESRGESNYSVTLFQMVDALLRDAKLRLQDVDLIAAATGPGSFTGIRVGLAAAQGWAQAMGCAVRGVSVLEAMAEQARPAAHWAVPILDARRGEFYVSVVHCTDAMGAPIGRAGASEVQAWGSVDIQVAAQPEGSRDGARQPGLLLSRESVPRFLGKLKECRRAGESVSCVVSEWDRAAQALRGAVPATLGWHAITGPLTGAIARRALIAHREGGEAPNQLDALYLRRSDAEMHWKED